eukprot:CAMPEP_0173193386 /NCGR_PEP_ID=MMETSP1141-20130122/13928_1 /TAXON_ID=483371 /ORGANISM="non described non described, Strain CCMP2298" /LENGTH=50 /DNA_ID=CAMNT_0014117713 /DNA_START=239 /DNA_END=391 /DNA_ORIENTATION=-
MVIRAALSSAADRSLREPEEWGFASEECSSSAQMGVIISVQGRVAPAWSR